MKDKRTLTVFIMWAVSFAFIWYYMGGQRNNQPVPPVKQLVAQAQKLEKKAGTDKKALRKAASAYENIGKVKQYKGTEEAADAKLQAAIIYDLKIKDSHTAEKAYSSLIKQYGKTDFKAVDEAKQRLEAMKVQVTEKHKDEIGYKAIDWLVALTGRNPAYSYALALLIITLVFKLVTTPLSHAQYKSMKEMQRLQPKIKQLQEKYKDNQQELGKKMMDLYKEHGVNPLSGCLPLLIQMPFLIGLWKYVIQPYQFEFAKGDFLWIGSGLAKTFPGIVASNLSHPDIPLVIIYTISMIISQKLSIVDPTQAEQQKMMMYIMPVMFAFIFWSFPSAFMLYWLFFNIVSTVQQYYILKHPGVNGTGGTNGSNGTMVIDQEPAPKPASVTPGSKSRRRRRRFDVLPQPVLHPTPGG